MKRGLFRIGEAAEISGLSAKALRFYEGAGLVKPSFVDPETGYRYYSGEELSRLEVIRSARAVGMGIGEIKAMLEAKDCAGLIAGIEAQEARSLARIEELRRAIASLRSFKSSLEDCLAAPASGASFLREIPERLILTEAISADPDIEEVARASSALAREARRRRLTNRYESGILLAPAGGSAFRPSAAFAVVDAAEPSDSSGLTRLPAGSYACVRYSEANAAPRQAALAAFLRRRRLEPVLVLQADLASAAFSIGEDEAELQALVSPGSPAAAPGRRGAAKDPRGATKPRR